MQAARTIATPTQLYEAQQSYSSAVRMGEIPWCNMFAPTDATLILFGLIPQGGEQRRVALALTLAFSELALERASMSCDLMVLDEVLSLLDAEGCTRAAGVLRSQRHKRTILVVAQANSLLARLCDSVDVVHKSGGVASVPK